MSATPATTAEGGRRWGSEFFAVLQRIGRSLMLPMPLLFTVGVAPDHHRLRRPRARGRVRHRVSADRRGAGQLRRVAVRPWAGGPGSTAPPTAPSSPSACITSIATGPLLIIPVGLAYAVLYYFLFRAHPPLRPGHTRPRTHGGGGRGGGPDHPKHLTGTAPQRPAVRRPGPRPAGRRPPDRRGGAGAPGTRGRGCARWARPPGPPRSGRRPRPPRKTLWGPAVAAHSAGEGGLAALIENEHRAGASRPGRG
jgi:hypothetical protein